MSQEEIAENYGNQSPARQQSFRGDKDEENQVRTIYCTYFRFLMCGRVELSRFVKAIKSKIAGPTYPYTYLGIDRALDCPTLPCLILSYLILSHFILSHLTLSHLILSYLILSYLILSYLILLYLTRAFYFLLSTSSSSSPPQHSIQVFTSIFYL